MENTPYSAFYSRDINNFFAIKSQGVKTKGSYAFGGLSKNPDKIVCIKAVIELLSNGTPISETIRASKDIRDFVSVRKVTDGCSYDGQPLGKSIRFYYSTKSKGCFVVNSNGSKVPSTDGAVPLMTLLDKLPTDIDYLRYEIEANRILDEISFSQFGLFD
jgi:hypothetical protein